MRIGYSRTVVIGIALVLLGTVSAAAYYGSRLAPVGTAFTAKTLCSGVFVSHRDPASVLALDLSPDIHPILRVIDARTDQKARAVSASLFGLAERKAVYRDGFGCVVVNPNDSTAQATTAADLTPMTLQQPILTDDLRTAGEPPQEVDAAALHLAVDWAFSEPDPESPRNTRAVVVVHDGRIVAERYADGFTRTRR